MSTPIRNKAYRTPVIPCAKQFVVNKEQGPESLADYVRRVRNEKRLSLADVSLRAGRRIGRTHINRIENGEATGVSVEKLRALAKGLGVPEEEVFTIARGESPLDDPQFGASFFGMLFEKFVKVPEEQRDYILSLFRMIDREMEAVIKLRAWQKKMDDPKVRKQFYEKIDRNLGDPPGTARREYLKDRKKEAANAGSKGSNKNT